MADEDDVKELKEVFEVLSENVPKLIEEIVNALYSTSNAEQLAKEVANFYKTMIDAGMSEDKAYELTKKFMESRDIIGVVKKILSDKGLKGAMSIGKPPMPPHPPHPPHHHPPHGADECCEEEEEEKNE